MNSDNPLFVSQPLKLSDIVIKLLPTNRTIIIQKQPISNTNITETMKTDISTPQLSDLAFGSFSFGGLQAIFAGFFIIFLHF